MWQYWNLDSDIQSSEFKWKYHRLLFFPPCLQNGGDNLFLAQIEEQSLLTQSP